MLDTFNPLIITDGLIEKYDKPIVQPETLGFSHSSGGFRTNLLGYAQHNGELLGWHIADQRMSVQATISAFHSNRITKPVTHKTAYSTNEKYVNASDKWTVWTETFEKQGITNAMILSSRVLAPKPHDKLSYCVASNVWQLIRQARIRVQNAVSPQIPIMPHWEVFMFKRGVDAQKIRKVKGEGLNVYLIDVTDDFWSEMLVAGLQDGSLPWSLEEMPEGATILTDDMLV